MGLSYGFILWVYPMGLSYGSCREVIQEWLSYGFILWVYPISCREVIREWLSYGFVVLHHHVPVTQATTIPLIRTFNPDLYTGLLPKVLTTVVT